MKAPKKSRREYYFYYTLPPGPGFEGTKLDYGTPYELEFRGGEWWYNMSGEDWVKEDRLFNTQKEAVAALLLEESCRS